LPLRDLSAFVHQQLLRYITDANLRIATKDFLTYLDALLSVKEINEEPLKSQLVPCYKKLLTRCGKRFQRPMIENLYRFVGEDATDSSRVNQQGSGGGGLRESGSSQALGSPLLSHTSPEHISTPSTHSSSSPSPPHTSTPI
jgi:hypothetical protein